MRWPVVRLIASREIRDQVRDRRTLFLILGLPVLMYFLFAGVALLFYVAIKEKKLVVGVVGAEYLPKSRASVSLPMAAVGGVPLGYAYDRAREFPPLLIDGHFPQAYLSSNPESGNLIATGLDSADESLLAARQVDAILVVDPKLTKKLEDGERPTLRVLARDGEENSKLAVRRLTGVLHNWADEVKAAPVRPRRVAGPVRQPHRHQGPAHRQAARKEEFRRAARRAGEDDPVTPRDVDADRRDLPGHRHDGRRERARHDGDAPHQPGRALGDRLRQVLRCGRDGLRHGGLERRLDARGGGGGADLFRA